MAGYTRIPKKQLNPFENFWQQTGFYNFNKDTAKQQGEISQAELIDQIINRAKTDTSYATTLVKQGLMKPDGTLNYERFQDKQLINDLKNQLAENNQQSIQAAREAANLAQMRGIGGGNQNMAGVTNQNMRKNTRETMNTVGAERRRAGEEAKWFGGKAQQDLIDDLNKKVNAAGSIYQIDKNNYDAEGDGVFQSPEKTAAFIGDALGIVSGLGSLGSMVNDGLGIAKQITGGGNKPVGSAGASNPFKGDMPGATKKSTSPTNYGNMPYNEGDIDAPQIQGSNGAQTVRQYLAEKGFTVPKGQEAYWYNYYMNSDRGDDMTEFYGRDLKDSMGNYNSMNTKKAPRPKNPWKPASV